ncbi:MAG: NACHT domain-containing protein, partial [Leptolyngbya sp. SIO4C5]|nr:NACHT domain-containing protein [Leptolyngbya sp. SIO4C5]
MNTQPPQPNDQNINLSARTLDGIQIGGIAGRDLQVTQNQRVYVTNVFDAVQVEPAALSVARSLSAEEYRWRQKLLANVKHSWIEGVLEKSLHTQVLIELGLEERRDAIQNPLKEIDEFSTESNSKVLPKGTEAEDVFEELGTGRTLLILGEPGSGKTVTLLKITQSLIQRTENAETFLR